MKLFQTFKVWCLDGWEGESFSFGYIFLAIAVWDSFVAAFNMLVMPRIYSLDLLIWMTPISQILPVAICLVIAAYSRGTGVKATLKAYGVIGVIAFTTFMLWNPQSEAWLNHWGYKLIS